MRTEAQRKANNKWLKEHYVNRTLKLNLKNDKDILDFLKEKESVNKYLKELIREDIKRQETE